MLRLCRSEPPARIVPRWVYICRVCGTTLRAGRVAPQMYARKAVVRPAMTQPSKPVSANEGHSSDAAYPAAREEAVPSLQRAASWPTG